MKYDYLIVGAGLYGSVFAREAADRGRKCLVIDRRPHIAGNVYCLEEEGILIHRYGAHIFHTSSDEVWEYVNRFVHFNHYINSPVAVYKDELYNLPFNMNTFSKMWGIRTPDEAKRIIADQIRDLDIKEPRNLEEQALSLVGRDVYEKLVKGYTEKQWGRRCTELPAFIIRRLPLRFVYDNNYFSDPHQGIPVEGYTRLVEKLLEGSDVLLETSYREFIAAHPDIAEKTVYTGMIDEFFDYRFGHLSYRSVRFEDEHPDTDNYQGNAVVNYTEAEVPYTRIIEHKHFAFGNQPTTIISKEYPCEWKPGDEPYYPVNDEANMRLYEKYRELAASRPDVIFGGRLGNYKYYDMDKVIAAALEDAATELV
ncbi:MAG: UDP-galactopyranose mutase [Lachnospiraceae bacterium]|nr:UDP-galactopyranose mutase [Lachnospiraceae bacterium]